MSSAQRVTRATGHDTIAVEASAAPSFSTGTTATHAETPTPLVARRSTRKAAARASDRIAQGATTQRRSTRLTARNAEAARVGGAGREAPSPARRHVSAATRARGTKDTPIVLDHEDVAGMDLKPAAAGGSVAADAAASAAQKPPADFTCAICLDAPSSLTEVASVDGCTHRFCFDCIDKWARTENKCPCCKARFRTIDRVAPLPAPRAATSPARRGKRKRAAATAGPGATARARRGASPARPRRVNSRVVEDRNQESLSSFPINAAIVEQILASFSNFGGPRRGVGQVTFGTSEDGRPAIRMIRPASGSNMVGVMEMLLPADIADGEGGPGLAAGGGSTRMAHVTFSRAPMSSRTGGTSRSSLAGLPTSGAAAVEEDGTRRSTGVARGSGAASVATRPASASSRAARQGGPIFESLFASHGSSTMASPRSRRAADGVASAASSTRTGESSSSRPNRMTIRVIARERAAVSNRRTTGASGSGADLDEPIIID